MYDQFLSSFTNIFNKTYSVDSLMVPPRFLFVSLYLIFYMTVIHVNKMSIGRK